VNTARGNRKKAEAEQRDGVTRALMGRRGLLGGLASIPVLYSVGGAVGSASAATAPAAPQTAPPTGVSPADSGLIRGAERRYNAPLLTAGTRLVLPAGVEAVAVLGYPNHSRLASTTSTWPTLTAADGGTVDASVIPERGASSRVAVLSRFSEGWYELRHADGRAERVTWDAEKLPFLWFHGEFGANEHPYSVFFSLSLQPLSQNPFSDNVSIR
jgi:hypothetical protein